MPEQLTNSLLNYRLQSPLVDEVLKEVGIDLSKGMKGITDAVSFNASPIVATPSASELTSENETEELRRLAGIGPKRGK